MHSCRLASARIAASWLSLAAVSLAQAAATLVVSDAAVTPSRKTSAIPFVITRSGDLGFDVTVNYATHDGTALAGRDYTATSGTLTIPAGQSSATVNVTLLTKLARQARSFTLDLSNATASAPTGPLWSAAGNAVSGRYAEGSAVADFNGDGKPDVAFPSFDDDTVTVLRNDTSTAATTANFAPAAVLTGTSGPARLVAVDLNGDGKPDLVVPNLNTNRVNVYMNTTPVGALAFSFSNTAVGYPAGGSIQVAAADIDGDGRPDVVIAGVTPGKVNLLLNRTPVGAAVPTFAAPGVFTVGTGGDAYVYALTTLDVDGDGRPDVAVSNLLASEVVILRNTTVKGASAASFATPVGFRTADGATGLAAADIDGDGRPDLVTAETGSSTAGTTWSVLLNRTPAGVSTPSFAISSQVGPAPYSVALKDLDGDGRPDVVLAALAFDGAEGNGGLAVFLNRTAKGDAAATLVPYASIRAGDEPHTVGIADFNGDGRQDLATMDTASTLAGFFYAVAPVTNPQVGIGDASATGTIQPRSRP